MWKRRSPGLRARSRWRSEPDARAGVKDLVVVFRSPSDVEARIVRGLLEAHGIPSVTASGLSHALFPLSVDDASEIRISVHPDEAEEAQRIIESHRSTEPSGQVIRLRDEFEDLQRAMAYRFRD